MSKINFGILKQKKGPLPVWTWALIGAVIIYALYRHFQSSGGGSTGGPTAADSSIPNAPGDVGTGDTPGNAGDTLPGEAYPDSKLAEAYAKVGQSAHDLIDKTNELASELDNAQGDGTPNTDSNSDSSSSTDTGSAPLGLTHISGDYWWDPDNHKLIKIPGSGGTKKGSGKKKVPNKSKAGGKKKKVATKRPSILARTHTRVNRNASRNRTTSTRTRPLNRSRTRPRPQAHTQPLTAAQRRAIDRAHHPTTRQAPLRKPPVRRAPRVLPRRPTPRRPR